MPIPVTVILRYRNFNKQNKVLTKSGSYLGHHIGFPFCYSSEKGKEVTGIEETF